jgi:hypothetical protein
MHKEWQSALQKLNMLYEGMDSLKSYEDTSTTKSKHLSADGAENKAHIVLATLGVSQISALASTILRFVRPNRIQVHLNLTNGPFRLMCHSCSLKHDANDTATAGQKINLHGL